MSYRTIKRLLGETSLERKCRFLFGGALLLLLTGSFYVYAMLNLRIVTDHSRDQARLLISQAMLTMHLGIDRDKTLEKDRIELERLEKLGLEFKPSDLSENQWKFLRSNWKDEPTGDRLRQPTSQPEFEAMRLTATNIMRRSTPAMSARSPTPTRRSHVSTATRTSCPA
jgi:hypothetical protein